MSDDIDNRICIVRLRNGEMYYLSTDGWNPGDMVEALGPLAPISTLKAFGFGLWTLDVDEIVAVRPMSDRWINEMWSTDDEVARDFAHRHDPPRAGRGGIAFASSSDVRRAR